MPRIPKIPKISVKAWRPAGAGPRLQDWLGRIGHIVGQKRRIATVAAAGLAVAVGYHVVFGQNGLTAFEQKRASARQMDHQVKDLQRENDALRGHVDRLQTDPNAIEHQAREELHYTRPGEVIVTLPPDPNPPAHTPKPHPEDQPSTSDLPRQ